MSFAMTTIAMPAVPAYQTNTSAAPFDTQTPSPLCDTQATLRVLHPGRQNDDVELGSKLTEVHHLPAPVAQLSVVRGNPAPFGLLCNGMTTFMLMFIISSWSSAGLTPLVAAYALFYGGVGQLTAGILELIRGSTFAGTTFATYGTFWMGWGLLRYWETTSQVSSVLASARTGDTLWCALYGLLTLLFFVVTLRKNRCLQTVFATLSLLYFLLAGSNYSDKCKLAAGYVGLFNAAATLYAAIASLYQTELGWNAPGLAPTNYV